MTPIPTTTPSTAPARAGSAPARAARLLRADAAVTGLLGAVALLGPDVWGGDVPGWLPRFVGAVLVVVAADIALAARWSGRRLRLAVTVVGELALGSAVALGAVLALVDLPTTGRELVAVAAVLCAGFGVAELRAARALR